MVDDTVNLKKLQHFLYIFFFGVIGTYDKQLGVGFGHTVEGIFRVQGGKYPAVAVGRSQDVGVQSGKQLRVRTESSPDRHTVPVNAVLLTFYCTFAVFNSFFQLRQQYLIDIQRLLGSSADHGGAHQSGSIKKGQGRRGCRGRIQNLFPDIRAIPGKPYHFFELIQFKFFTGYFFQGLNHGLHLFGDGCDMGLGNISNISVGINTDEGGIEFFSIPFKPVLYVPTLVGVVNQHIGFGNTVNIINLGQRGDPFYKRADIRGKV